MRQPILAASLIFVATMSFAPAGSAATLAVTLGNRAPGAVLADRHAFCPPAGTIGVDVSPAVTWSAGPPGTLSYAVRMQDLDVPKALDQIEKPGVTIASSAPRISVDHWVLADIPSDRRSLVEGEDGTAFVKGGKPTGATGHGVRGANVYASFFASNPDMAGPYGGYDGPCPPRNDEKPHRYVVEVFALDVSSLKLAGSFTGETMAAAMAGHVIAHGQASTSYSRWEGRQ